MKRYATFLACCAVCAMSHAQSPMTFPLNLKPVSPTEIGLNLPDEIGCPKRTPERNTTLPTFCQEYDKIVITSDFDWGEFTYYIVNEDNEIVLSDNGIILSCVPYTIDISILDTGCYTLVIMHGKYYASTFAKD